MWNPFRRRKAECKQCVQYEAQLCAIRKMHIDMEEGKPWEAHSQFQGGAVQLWAASCVQWFREQGGKNYVRPAGYAAMPGTGPEGETCGSCNTTWAMRPCFDCMRGSAFRRSSRSRLAGSGISAAYRTVAIRQRAPQPNTATRPRD